MAAETISKTVEISLPGDLFPTLKELADYAIYQAREEMEDYVMPAYWEAIHKSGDIGDFEVVFSVTRYSHK